MVLVKAGKESESGVVPIRQKMTEMGKFNDELVKAGIMLVGEGLKPSSAGVRVRFSGKDRIVTDGPFAETEELIAGYWVWEVRSMEEAITWLKRCPNPMTADSEVEIRPIWSLEDVDEAIKRELQQEQSTDTGRIRRQWLTLVVRRLDVRPFDESYSASDSGITPVSMSTRKSSGLVFQVA
jgi:hypothetical protein